MAAPHLCHMFSTFATGGPQVRTASIIDALDGRFRHTIVALDNNFAASKLVSDSASVQFVAPPPGKGGAAYSLTLRRLLKQLRPDLLVTYNWGAMDGVIAAQIGRVCPVVHTEDGFGPDEASARKKRRVLVRRWALRFIAGNGRPVEDAAADRDRGVSAAERARVLHSERHRRRAVHRRLPR